MKRLEKDKKGNELKAHIHLVNCMQLVQKSCCVKNNLTGYKCELRFYAMLGDFHTEFSHISPRYFTSLVGFYVTDISAPL